MASILALTGSFWSGAAAAQSLTFTSASSPAFDFAEAALEAESGSRNLNLKVALVDLNGDGRDDIFAFAENSYYCGSAGCTPSLFLSNKKSWRQVPFGMNVMTNSVPEMWSLMGNGNVTIDGYKPLTMTTPEGQVHFYWNQYEYVAGQ